MASCGYPNGLWLPVAIPLASSGYPNGFLWLFKWWLPVGAVLVQDYGRFGSLVVAPKAPPPSLVSMTLVPQASPLVTREWSRRVSDCRPQELVPFYTRELIPYIGMRWTCRHCLQLEPPTADDVLWNGSRPALAHCHCVWTGFDGTPILRNRLCFVIGCQRKVMRWCRSGRPHCFVVSAITRGGWVDGDAPGRSPVSSTMSIGAFLPLRLGFRRYRLVQRCRRRVLLAQFLQCQDCRRLCLCSRGMRASVSPNATDLDWCRLIARQLRD